MDDRALQQEKKAFLSDADAVPFESEAGPMFECGRWSMPSNERPFSQTAECSGCREVPRVDEFGYCGHCHWAARAEVEAGFRELEEYLSAWALLLRLVRGAGAADRVSLHGAALA
jgi:hypothetical protein